MKGIEEFGSEEPIPHDIEVEGLTPDEVSLASAERLMVRLEARGELTNDDKKEVNRMLKELKRQKSFFEDEQLVVPAKLEFVIKELARLATESQLSVRELMNRPDPKDVAEDAAEKARKELEKIANA